MEGVCAQYTPHIKAHAKTLYLRHFFSLLIFFNWIIGQLNQLTSILPHMDGVEVQYTPHIEVRAKMH